MKKTPRQTHADSGGRLIRFTAILAATMILQGCALTIPTPSDNDTHSDTTKVERATASEIWKVLAAATEARTIDSTTRLAQFVAVLARNGELSPDDVAAFDLAFPHIVQNARPLTKTDTEVLLTLSRRGA